MYDAIVVGSGFGGAVTAAKLTTNGKTVLTLEKGHRWRRPKPNDPTENLHLGASITNLVDSNGFPKAADKDKWDNPQYVLRQSTDLKYISFKSPQTKERSGGLSEDYLGDNFAVTVGRGYGGGSLIYSQIHLRAPSETFLETGWGKLPFNRSVLDPYYLKVERTLLTFEQTWDDIPKRAAVIADSMARLGITCEPARLGNYRIAKDSDRGLPPIMNKFGRAIEPCNGCGFCTFGCIFNARQSLMLNYLAQAEDSGRFNVRTDAVAWAIEPIAGGYRVHWYDYRTGSWKYDDAKAVITAAGAVNSPELLLRSRDMYDMLPNLSNRVGMQLSGNGDAAFAALYPNLPEDFKAEIYQGHIMTLVTYHWWKSKRFIIEDVGTAPVGLAKFPLRREGGDGRYWGPQVKSLLRNHYAKNVVGLGAMGIDSPDGRVTIDSTGNAKVEWTKSLVAGERTYDLMQAIRSASEAIVKAGGGEMLHEKEWSDNRRLITVHPLGGCRMATNINEGVVDTRGMVFNYPGIFVIDGSIMPGAIGVNPSLTIAAIAEKLSDDVLNWLQSR
ncbi:MAG: GMC family oxidoreductase [Acidobacteriota bacterium]